MQPFEPEIVSGTSVAVDVTADDAGVMTSGLCVDLVDNSSICWWSRRPAQSDSDTGSEMFLDSLCCEY
jgi:hypothetical protein